MRKSDVLTARLGAVLELAEDLLLEWVHGATVVRSAGEARCVRFTLGDEALGCFLPVYDHRPAVVEAAKALGHTPATQGVPRLLAALRAPCAVEVKARPAQGKRLPFVTLWPQEKGRTEVRVTGRRHAFAPEAVGEGVSSWGLQARWHWTGLLPAPGGGLTVLQVALERLPQEEARPAPPR